MDSNCPLVIFLSLLFLPAYVPPSLRYNITHSSNHNFYLGITYIFFLNYFQFYPSRKALVIKTYAFNIIINLNSFFTSPNIN